MLVTLARFMIANTTLNTAARYITCFLLATDAYSANVDTLRLVSATSGEISEKKAVALSMADCISTASSVYTACLFPPRMALDIEWH
ncbi:hypothetical protein IAT40_007675 [Kwoniella sp. CBS 6097]